MSSEALAPPISGRNAGMALAALGPLAVGGIVAARAQVVAPLFTTPAILFGVVAATAPALYIGLAATGDAPPVAKVVRAFGVAFAAFGITLAGLLLPTTFLAASSTSEETSYAVASAALAAAGILGLARLARELKGAEPRISASVVFGIRAIATGGIAGRLWFDLVQELL
jgi:hypothetical protein